MPGAVDRRPARASASCPCASPASCRTLRRSRTYALEYGTDTLEIHDDALGAGERALIVDDVIATGGTARGDRASSCASWAREVAGFAFLVELSFLNGRARAAGATRCAASSSTEAGLWYPDR